MALRRVTVVGDDLAEIEAELRLLAARFSRDLAERLQIWAAEIMAAIWARDRLEIGGYWRILSEISEIGTRDRVPEWRRLGSEIGGEWRRLAEIGVRDWRRLSEGGAQALRGGQWGNHLLRRRLTTSSLPLVASAQRATTSRSRRWPPPSAHNWLPPMRCEAPFASD